MINVLIIIDSNLIFITYNLKSDLEKHESEEHAKDEWNCNDCAFQSESATDLMKHLKITSHQPSQSIKDKRKLFRDFKECYTCKMAFDGYVNLMNHRKNIHPSNKKCKNFPSGKCKFVSGDCWYVHGEEMDTDELFEQFNCNLCEYEAKGRDSFMKHKKESHPQNVPICNSFLKNGCYRSDQDCWFDHQSAKGQSRNPSPKKPKTKPSTESTEKPVFQEAVGNSPPPDQVRKMMDMVSRLCSKMEKMEMKLEELLM